MSQPRRGDFTRGTSVLAALVFVAVLSTIAYGVHSIVPSDSLAQTASSHIALESDEPAGLIDDGSEAKPRAELIGDAPRCRAPIELQQDKNAAVKFDATQDVLNVCVPGCLYQIREGGEDTTISVRDLCTDGSGANAEKCNAMQCLVQLCKESGECEAVSAPVANLILGTAAGVKPSIQIKSDLDLQKALADAKVGSQEAYNNLPPYLKEAFKAEQGEMVALNQERIANNLDAIKEMGTDNSDAREKLEDETARLQRENQNLSRVTSAVSSDQSSIAPGCGSGLAADGACPSASPDRAPDAEGSNVRQDHTFASATVCGQPGANPDSCIPESTRETGSIQESTKEERKVPTSTWNPYPEDEGTMNPESQKKLPTSDWKPERSLGAETIDCPGGICSTNDAHTMQELRKLGYECTDAGAFANCAKPASVTLDCPNGVCSTSDKGVIDQLKAQGYQCMGNVADGSSACEKPDMPIRDGAVPDQIEQTPGTDLNDSGRTSLCSSDGLNPSEVLWATNRGYKCSPSNTTPGTSFCVKTNPGTTDGCAPAAPTITPPAPPRSVTVAPKPAERVTIPAESAPRTPSPAPSRGSSNPFPESGTPGANETPTNQNPFPESGTPGANEKPVDTNPFPESGTPGADERPVDRNTSPESGTPGADETPRQSGLAPNTEPPSGTLGRALWDPAIPPTEKLKSLTNNCPANSSCPEDGLPTALWKPADTSAVPTRASSGGQGFDGPEPAPGTPNGNPSIQGSMSPQEEAAFREANVTPGTARATTPAEVQDYRQRGYVCRSLVNDISAAEFECTPPTAPRAPVSTTCSRGQVYDSVVQRCVTDPLLREVNNATQGTKVPPPVTRNDFNRQPLVPPAPTPSTNPGNVTGGGNGAGAVTQARNPFAADPRQNQINSQDIFKGLIQGLTLGMAFQQQQNPYGNNPYGNYGGYGYQQQSNNSSVPPAQCPPPPPQPSASACKGSWQQQSVPGPNGLTCVSGWTCAVTPDTTTRAQISCAPLVADAGMEVSISYTCAHASKSVGTNFSTGGALSGAAAATLGATSTAYSVSCINDKNETATASCTVQVVRPAIILVANPASVALGEKATIGWVTSGMQSCVVSSPDSATFTSQNAGNTATAGSAQTPSLAGPMRFDLSCETAGGSVRTASTTVTIK